MHLKLTCLYYINQYIYFHTVDKSDWKMLPSKYNNVRILNNWHLGLSLFFY